MTEEDEEFNRIERESRIKQNYLRDIKTPSREALMAEVAVLTEMVRVLSDKLSIEQNKQERGEPVGYLCENAVGHKYFRWKKPPSTYKPIAIYTTPQQRKPLTHEQRFDLLTQFEPHKNKWEAPAILIDMVETAHGIKE